MKMEFLSLKPDIVQIYDVIGPSGMTRIIKEAAGKYTRGVIAKTSTTTKKLIKVLNPMKVAMDVFAYDEAMELPAFNLSSVTTHLTHLSEFDAPIFRDKFNSGLRITSYSFTGRFLPHTDAVGTKYMRKMPKFSS